MEYLMEDPDLGSTVTRCAWLNLSTAAGLHDFHVGSNGMGGHPAARRSLTNLSELGAEKSPESANRFRAPPESLEAQLSYKLQASCGIRKRQTQHSLHWGHGQVPVSWHSPMLSKQQAVRLSEIPILAVCNLCQGLPCRIYLPSHSPCDDSHSVLVKTVPHACALRHGSCAGVC